MSLEPSHDCLLLKESFSNACLLSISQTDPVLAFVGRLTQRLHIGNYHAIHLLARCDRSDDPSARTTRRYLCHPPTNGCGELLCWDL